MTKISFLITAWKEAGSIGKCIRCLADSNYSGYTGDFEILLACPDEETYNAALAVVNELGLGNKFKHIKDPGLGKPFALNILMEEAVGDIWVFTDGDVWFAKNSVANLIRGFENPNTFMITGRPRSADSRNSKMGYFGHLLSDAADHKRKVDLLNIPTGKSLKFIKKRPFFPVSGYIYAMRRTDIRFPKDCLVDDAYISYVVFNQGKKIEYAPDAEVFVKYPTNLSDYFKQKKRSTGGYIQLWQYGVVKPETKTRSFARELEYFWFPIKYAKNIVEFFWSLMLYPIRLWLWIQIYWERRVLKKNFVKTWVRVESTK